MDAHQTELTELMRRHDRNRETKMDALRQKLAERRKKREADLKQKHAQQVRSLARTYFLQKLGLPA